MAEKKRGPKPKDAPPVPLKGAPKVPTGLDPVARQRWREVVPLLEEAGYLSTLDRHSLELYCTLWSRWAKAREELAGAGVKAVITLPNGFDQINPWYAIEAQARKELKSYLSEFGLSPKARQKLKLPEPEETDGKWSDLEE